MQGPTFVQGVVCVRLQEQVLETDHDGVQVEYRLPVLPQDVQAHISLQVNVRMIDLGLVEKRPP
jgi:hypothetical protein